MNQDSLTPQIFSSPRSNLATRYRVGNFWRAVFFLSTTIGIIALIVLVLNVLNQTFGLVVYQNKVNPVTLASQPLEQLSKDELVQVLKDNLTANRFKTINRDTPLDEQSRDTVYQLVIDRVVQPTIIASYALKDSLFNRAQIEQEAAEKYPGSSVEFHSWLNSNFLQNAMASRPELAGVRSALLGSLIIILITISFAFPIGVGAAIYLEEYANKRSWINRLIETNINNLAGVPSIVYGILGLAIFVRTLEPLTSGAIFGMTDSNGRTILSAALTLALLTLPIIIINAQEAIRAVPNSLRQAAFGLGATRWQTVWYHVLPAALPGILTGTILAISRAMGETAPLILVGASTFITSDPTGPFSKFTALPIQIYNWTARPQPEFRNIAAAAIIVLMISLLSLNTGAILLRNRFSKQR